MKKLSIRFELHLKLHVTIILSIAINLIEIQEVSKRTGFSLQHFYALIKIVRSMLNFALRTLSNYIILALMHYIKRNFFNENSEKRIFIKKPSIQANPVKLLKKNPKFHKS
jgi:hypothetical protein